MLDKTDETHEQLERTFALGSVSVRFVETLKVLETINSVEWKRE